MARGKATKEVSQEDVESPAEIKSILDYLGTNEHVFSSHISQKEAEQYRLAAATHFSSLVVPFQRMLVTDKSLDLEELNASPFQRIYDTLHARAKVEIVGTLETKTRIVTNFPIAMEDKMRAVRNALGDGANIIARDKNHAMRIYNLFIAGLIRALAKYGMSFTQSELAFADSRFWYAGLKLESFEIAQRWGDQIFFDASSARAQISEGEKLLADALQKVAALESQFGELAAQIANEGDAVGKLNQSTIGLAASLTRQQESSAERLENFEKGMKERFALKGASGLWRRKATAGRIAWGVSFIVIVVILTGSAAAILLNSAQIIAFVKHIDVSSGTLVDPSNPAATYVAQTLGALSRLLLVSAPLALIVWVVRFLMRYNMRSLLLMDDASQRQTIMDTYFQLVERGIASPGTDRAVLLEALFRGLPGHGADGPEPPNLVELMKVAEQVRK